eukprot:2754680-Rhodomonas_salina.2
MCATLARQRSQRKNLNRDFKFECFKFKVSAQLSSSSLQWGPGPGLRRRSGPPVVTVTVVRGA